MNAGGITFIVIVAAELCLLFHLLLPRVLAFCESRYDQVYSLSDTNSHLREPLL